MLNRLIDKFRNPAVSKPRRIRRPSSHATQRFEALESRSMMAGIWCLTPEPPLTYQPSVDPVVGAVVTAFVSQDPENAQDSYDVLTGWIAAVDELKTVGASEVSFGVYRQVNQGVISGGPSVETVAKAVAHANQNNLSVTILPIFETQAGWRGNYDPVGGERAVFQQQYQQWISDLSKIEGIDRLNIGSELNQMVANEANVEILSKASSIPPKKVSQSQIILTVELATRLTMMPLIAKAAELYLATTTSTSLALVPTAG